MMDNTVSLSKNKYQNNNSFTAPVAIRWKAVLGILEYINGNSEYGITFQRGTLSIIVFRWMCSRMLTTPLRQN